MMCVSVSRTLCGVTSQGHLLLRFLEVTELLAFPTSGLKFPLGGKKQKLTLVNSYPPLEHSEHQRGHFVLHDKVGFLESDSQVLFFVLVTISQLKWNYMMCSDLAKHFQYKQSNTQVPLEISDIVKLFFFFKLQYNFNLIEIHQHF